MLLRILVSWLSINFLLLNYKNSWIGFEELKQTSILTRGFLLLIVIFLHQNKSLISSRLKEYGFLQTIEKIRLQWSGVNGDGMSVLEKENIKINEVPDKSNVKYEYDLYNSDYNVKYFQFSNGIEKSGMVYGAVTEMNGMYKFKIYFAYGFYSSTQLVENVTRLMLQNKVYVNNEYWSDKGTHKGSISTSFNRIVVQSHSLDKTDCIDTLLRYGRSSGLHTIIVFDEPLKGFGIMY